MRITIAISVLVFIALVPFATIPLLKVTAFIGLYDAALFFTSLLTSVFFFCQYARLNSPAFLAVAGGYLFDALMIVPHALSFPELFTVTGLLGNNSQITAWLYMFWHSAFPLYIIAYAMLDKETRSTGKTDLMGIFITIIGTTGVVGLLTYFVIFHIALLPLIIASNVYLSNFVFVVGSVWGVGILACVILVWRGLGSTLDLWLMVVMCAWICDVALSAVFNHGRYDVGFYAGRVYGLVAAGFVQVMLIIETSKLAATLEMRVRERTEKLRYMISERERLEGQLLQIQKMDAIGKLTGGMAHDFNNLMNIIVGNIDMLDRLSQDKETDAVLEDVLDAALQASELTKRMLAFARQQPLQPQHSDINKLIANIVKLLDRSLGAHIQISLHLAPDIWPVVVDPVQFETAITNLATNARDAILHDGRIIIATYNQHLDADEHLDIVAGDYAVTEFRDNGTGIPPEIIDKIFDPFFTTKEIGKGSGLGLSMVFGFMKQSGGNITVDSIIGRTTFRLFLPRSPN